MWARVIDRPLLFEGDATNSFDAAIGHRVFDWMRIEASYYRPNYQLAGKRLSIKGHAITANAVFDARINNLYSFMSRQWFVPYVGAGFGLSFNKVNSDLPFRNARLDHTTPLIFNIMAGLSIEFNKSFALDIGYKYFYMAAPHLSMNVDVANYELDDFSPTAHQVRAGIRISF
jgi:opacity protein-like surface antigen